MDEIERILQAEELIAPSPGFAQRVMESVHREAMTPAPIAFPWRQLLTGMATAGALIAAGTIVISRSAIELRLPALGAPGPGLTAAAGGLGWTLAALAGTYVLTRVAHYLVRS